MESIPFNRPSFVGNEAEYIQQALGNGRLSGDGPFTRRCHELLEEIVGAPKALLTTSCTHALEMAALLLDIAPGDEVIVPTFTFVSTANAFVLRGARIVFADVRPDTLNLDEASLERLITPKTAAIVVVHYGGVACEMDAIMEIASRHGVPVVEDNAHGLFGRYRGRPLGSFGLMATQSFHETKNLSAGEGGALLMNDSRLIRRAEILREKGTDRSRFFRGEVDKYTWVDLGSSYLPSEITAAVLLAQLEQRDRIQEARRRIWSRYHERLEDWAARQGVGRPVVPDGAEPAWHLYHLILPTAEDRDRFIEELAGQGIMCVFHYLPLHLSPMGRAMGGESAECPVAVDVSDRLVRLPFYNELTREDQDRVISAILTFRTSARPAPTGDVGPDPEVETGLAPESTAS